MDVDEDTNSFVAHFRTPEATDLFFSKEFKEVVGKKVTIPQVQGDCNFGGNGAEDLGREILKFCEDVAFAEIEASHCECKAHVA